MKRTIDSFFTRKNNPETPVGPVPVSQTSDDDSSEDESAGDVAAPKKPKPYHFRQEWLTEFTWLRYCKEKKVMSCMSCSQCGPKFAGKTKFANSTTHFKHEMLVKHNNSIRHKLCRDRCNDGAKALLHTLFKRQASKNKSAEEAEMTMKFIQFK
ncbi:hypothetical protein ABVT39_008619 [Epinephelus coioides]